MKKSNSLKVLQAAWYGDIETGLDFPEKWTVGECRMAGHNAPGLTAEQVHQAIASPIGCPRLRELARSKKEVAIVFDDLSRPTQIAPLLPHVLEELWQADVPREGVRFIAGLGAHGPLTVAQFRKKLGDDIVRSFPVYNHNPYENCVFVGNTSQGTPVHVNAEFAGCDLRIGIGCIVPHGFAGFGGGSKIVLPGVASVETIVINHTISSSGKKGAAQLSALGEHRGNIILKDIEEAARLAGLHFKIDVLVNSRRETTAIFAGDPVAEFAEALKTAVHHYATPVSRNNDFVVANAYAKGNEATIACRSITPLLPESGGVLVIIALFPEGEVVHYLMRSSGKWNNGRLWKPRGMPPRVRKLVLMAPFMDKASLDWFAPLDRINWVKSWHEVIATLKSEFPGVATGAVVPDATIQYFPGRSL